MGRPDTVLTPGDGGGLPPENPARAPLGVSPADTARIRAFPAPAPLASAIVCPVTPVVPLRPPTRAVKTSLLDEDAVEATRRGEGWAWELAYQAYARPLTGFLHLRLRDREEVAEAVSETFLRGLGRCSGFRGDAVAFRAWLFRIARNVATDRLRAAQRRTPGTWDADPPDLLAGEHSDGLISGEETAAVRRAMGRLDPDDREILWLRVCTRLSSAEVGEIVGKKAGAVRMQQQRALGLLARHLEAGS